MENISRGKIYYVYETEFAKKEQENRRVCLIVSNDKYSKYSTFVEIVYLLTREKRMAPTHVKINSTLSPFTALCEHIVTVDKNRLGACIGRITEIEQNEIDKALTISLGLTAENNKQEPEHKSLKIKACAGWIVASKSCDPDYPGIDVEYVCGQDDDSRVSRFRVLVEYPGEDGLRAFAWTDRDNEDYIAKIIF